MLFRIKYIELLFLGKMLSASQEIATSTWASTVLPTSALVLLLHGARSRFVCPARSGHCRAVSLLFRVLRGAALAATRSVPTDGRTSTPGSCPRGWLPPAGRGPLCRHPYAGWAAQKRGLLSLSSIPSVKAQKVAREPWRCPLSNSRVSDRVWGA